MLTSSDAEADDGADAGEGVDATGETIDDENQVTFFVAPDGSDDIDGAQAQNRDTPFQSISRAVAEAQAGQRIAVADGNYDEDIFLNNSGTADGEIVIEAENEQGAVLNGFFHGRNVSHITVDGFDISNPEPENPEIAQGVVFYESHNITVSDNVVHDSFGGGIAFNQSDSTLIEGNTVNGNGLLHPDAHSGISVYQPQQREDADG